MPNPIRGNNKTIHKFSSRVFVNKLNDQRKNAEAEPTSIPIAKQIKNHLVNS